MTNYNKTAAFYSNQKIAKLRNLLARDHGVRKYRISTDGNVNVYSIESGWYLLGSVAHEMAEYNI